MPRAGKDVEQVELLHTADEDVKWHGHVRKQVGNFLKG